MVRWGEGRSTYTDTRVRTVSATQCEMERDQNSRGECDTLQYSQSSLRQQRTVWLCRAVIELTLKRNVDRCHRFTNWIAPALWKPIIFDYHLRIERRSRFAYTAASATVWPATTHPGVGCVVVWRVRVAVVVVHDGIVFILQLNCTFMIMWNRRRAHGQRWTENDPRTQWYVTFGEWKHETRFVIWFEVNGNS